MNNFDPITAEITLVEHYRLNVVYGTIRLKDHIEQIDGLILNHKLI